MATTTAASAHTPSVQPAGRPQVKVGPGNNNNNNNNRRGMQSPIDGNNHKRNMQHKPWGQQPHSGNQQKYQVGGSNNSKRSAETDTPDKHQNDRITYLLGNLVGQKVIITLKSGARVIGIFSSSTVSNGEIGCVLKFAKQYKAAPGDDEKFPDDYIGGGNEKMLIIEPKDLLDLTAENVTLESADPNTNQNVAGQFKTDVDISGNQPTRERELQRWQPEESSLAGGLEDSVENQPSGGSWDQFAVNEKLFGVKSDFDENIYTTKIDTNHPEYKQREAKAMKVAREIEKVGPLNGAALTAHQAEERNLAAVDDSGVDEEDKYSSVQRAPQSQASSSASGLGSKYTPPALRNPAAAQQTVQPTISTESPKEVAKEAIKEPVKDKSNDDAATVENTPTTASLQVTKSETASKKPVTPATPAVPVIPVITEQAPSPQPPSISSFKPDDTKPKEKPALPDSVKKASIAIPAVPILPILKGSESTATSSMQGNSGSAANVDPVKGVNAAFKQFTNIEREKVEKKRQAMAKKDKDVKLQDLKKFAQSFKLNTLVPQDLVPILAKDKAKQEEIIEKAKVNAAAAHTKKQTAAAVQAVTQASSATNTATAASNLRSPIPPGPSSQMSGGQLSQISSQGQHVLDKSGPGKGGLSRDRLPFAPQQPSAYREGRPAHLHANMNLPTAPSGRTPLSARIEHNQRMKQSGQYANMPVPIPVLEHSVPPTGPAAMQMQTKALSPTQANPKLSARAMEFRPNPAAADFISIYTSPVQTPTTPVPAASRATSPSVFFGNKKLKPVEERSSVNDAFDPFKRTKQAAGQNKDKPTVPSGKVQPKPGVIDKPWLTLPTWPVKDENKDKKYPDVFEKSDITGSAPVGPAQSHQGTSHQQPHNPHPAGNPIPTHITPLPHMPSDRHHPQHNHHLSAPPPHFGDQDHHPRQVASPPAVLPSPSMQNATISQYGSPATHHAMLYPNHPGQMQPQYGVLGQNGQFAAYRGGYAGTPQFIQPPGGAGGANPMAMGPQGQQQLGFMIPGMGGPFIQQGMPQGMYSPHQMHAFPGQPVGGPPPHSGGYPSPGRGAAMMMHQGSQQGHGTPVPAPMMLSMSNGPAGHPQPAHMIRPYHAPPPQYNQHPGVQQHHSQNQYGQYQGGRNGGHQLQAMNSMQGHHSGSAQHGGSHENEESK